MTAFLHEASLARGHALRLAGRFRAALAAYARAAAIAGDAAARADALAGAGMARRGLCEYATAARLFTRVLAVYRRRHDRAGEAFALYGRGGARRFRGEFAAARRDLDRALCLTRDPESRCFTLMARGGLGRMTGAHRRSLADYSRALLIARRARLDYARAYAHCGLGNAWRVMGEARRALPHLRRADRLYRAIGDRVSRPYTLWALALLAPGTSGRPLLTEASNLWHATADARGLVHADLGRAVLFEDRQALARARRHARRLGLKLEAAHAEWLASGTLAGYRRLGVKPPRAPRRIP